MRLSAQMTNECLTTKFGSGGFASVHSHRRKRRNVVGKRLAIRMSADFFYKTIQPLLRGVSRGGEQVFQRGLREPLAFGIRRVIKPVGVEQQRVAFCYL